MGVSINIHVYDYDDLVYQIFKLAKNGVPADRTPEFFVENILPKFGIRAGDQFFVLWNEYYEEYNSGSEMMTAAALYFGVEDVYFGNFSWFDAANARDVLEEFDIEPLNPPK